MSTLKAYYFPYKHYSKKITSNYKDVGVVACSKKDAVKELGNRVEDYVVSKAKVVDFEITSINKIVFKTHRYDKQLNETRVIVDFDIEAGVTWKFTSDRDYNGLNINVAEDDKTKEALILVYDEMYGEVVV